MAHSVPIKYMLVDDVDNYFPIKDCLVCEDINSVNSFLRNKDDLVSSKFRVVHQNIRSYNRNIDEFLIVLQGFNIKFNCIILTEAWLRSDTELVSIPGYNIYTTSDNLNQSDGIVVYLDNTLSATVNQLLLGGVATALSMTFDWAGQSYEIVAVYRSPNSNIIQFVEGVSKYYRDNVDKYHFRILTGDINCNILNPSHNSIEEKYIDTLYESGLSSCIDKVTRPISNSCIDHFFLKMKYYNEITPLVIQTNITDHYCIALEIKQFGSKNLAVVNSDIFRNRINWVKVETYLQNNSNKYILDCTDVDDCSSKLIGYIQNSLTSASEQVKINSKNTRIKPWISFGILTSIRKRDSLHKQLKKQPFNSVLRNRYRRYRNTLHSLIKITKYNYYKNKIDQAGGDVRKFWKIVGEVAGRPRSKDRFPVEGFCGNSATVTDSDIENLSAQFNSYFANVGTNLASAIVPVGPPVVEDAGHARDSVFALEPINHDQLINIIKSIKGGSAPGWDNIPAKILKDYSHYIVEPLLHLINLSIRTGKFPNALKIAKIIPIYKSGSKSSIINFRPISLLSVIDKVLEKCVKIQLVNYLNREGIISEIQYGFVKGRNTSDALFDLNKLIFDKMANKNNVLVTFLDLAKAFDSVNRKLLIKKLELLGVKNNSLNWFVTYFNNRMQYVTINGIDSVTTDVEYGVIQGSTLGPLLFLIYINNISQLNLNGNLFLFADDTALVSYGSTWDEAYDRASSDLINIKNWFDHNILSLNVDKTKYLPIYFKNVSGPGQRMLKMHSCGDPRSASCRCNTIERVNQYKYLGIIIDHKLSWEPHVQYLKQKVRKMIYAFGHLRQVLTVDRCRGVYYAYVQSVLQYCILVWGGASAAVLEPLAVIQRSIIKTILKKQNRYPTDLLFMYFPVLNLRRLYLKSLLTYIKENKNYIFTSSTHRYETRNRVHFGFTVPKLNFRANLFNSFYLAHQLYRNLPRDILVAEGGSIAVYKRKVEAWLLRIGDTAVEALLQSPYH